MIHAAAEGCQRVICGQGVAPAAARIDTFRHLGLDSVPGTGLLAATTPGCFDAWMLLLRDYGTLRLRDVLRFAIGYARHGYPMLPQISAAIQAVTELFATEWPSSAAVYLAQGHAPCVGDRFRNLDLAQTYGRIVSEAEAAGADRVAQIETARRIWSQGFVAAAIDEFSRDSDVLDSSGRRHRGLLTGEDMARWEASYEVPERYDYHGHTVLKAGFWSQGPVFLQALAILKGYNLSDMPGEGPDFVHTVVEAMKLAYADREAFYGDPKCISVPARGAFIGRLCSAAPFTDYGVVVDRAGAGQHPRPRCLPCGGRARGIRRCDGKKGGGRRRAHVGARRSCRAANRPRWIRSRRHLSLGRDRSLGQYGVGDAERGLAAEFSGHSRLGIRPWHPCADVLARCKLRVCFGSRTTASFDSDSRIGAARRAPLSRLRHPRRAISRISGRSCSFLRHVHHALNLQESIDAPMFHSEHCPSSFYPRAASPGRVDMEGRFPARTIRVLQQRGHRVVVGGPWSLGRLSAASQADGWLRAAANPRGMQGYAVGR